MNTDAETISKLLDETAEKIRQSAEENPLNNEDLTRAVLTQNLDINVQTTVIAELMRKQEVMIRMMDLLFEIIDTTRVELGMESAHSFKEGDGPSGQRMN